MTVMESVSKAARKIQAAYQDSVADSFIAVGSSVQAENGLSRFKDYVAGFVTFGSPG